MIYIIILLNENFESNALRCTAKLTPTLKEIYTYTNFLIKYYLRREEKRYGPIKFSDTRINNYLSPRQTAFTRSRDCETFIQFFIEKQEHDSGFLRNILTNVSIMRGKKCNTFLRIEILFLQMRSTSLRCSIESYTILNLNLRFEYRCAQKDSILSALFIRLAILDRMSLTVWI